MQQLKHTVEIYQIKETGKMFPKVPMLFYIPTNSMWEFQLLHILSNTCVVFFSPLFRHSNICLMVAHCGFNRHFSSDQRCLAFFRHFFLLFINNCLVKYIFRSFALDFNYSLRCGSFSYILLYKAFIRYVIFKIFPVCGL